MRLNEIRIDLQGFLQVLDGGRDVAGMKGFLGALEFLDGFGRDAQLADGDRVGGGPRRCRAIRSRVPVKCRERIGDIEDGGSIVDGGGSRRLGCAMRSLRVKIGGNEKREENKDRFFHVATLTVSVSWLTAPFLKREDSRSGELFFRSCHSACFTGKDERRRGFVWELASNCL